MARTMFGNEQPPPAVSGAPAPKAAADQPDSLQEMLRAMAERVSRQGGGSARPRVVFPAPPTPPDRTDMRAALAALQQLSMEPDQTFDEGLFGAMTPQPTDALMAGFPAYSPPHEGRGAQLMRTALMAFNNSYGAPESLRAIDIAEQQRADQNAAAQADYERQLARWGTRRSVEQAELERARQAREDVRDSRREHERDRLSDIKARLDAATGLGALEDERYSRETDNQTVDINGQQVPRWALPSVGGELMRGGQDGTLDAANTLAQIAHAYNALSPRQGGADQMYRWQQTSLAVQRELATLIQQEREIERAKDLSLMTDRERLLAIGMQKQGGGYLLTPQQEAQAAARARAKLEDKWGPGVGDYLTMNPFGGAPDPYAADGGMLPP